MLRRYRGYVWCRAGQTEPHEMIRFILMTGDKAGNNPTFANRDLEDQNMYEIPCICSRDSTEGWDNPAFFHFDMTLSLKLTLDRDLFQVVVNDGNFTDFFGFVVRLFWSLI